MSPQIKPIKVWGTVGLNPPKVYMIMEAIGLPYEGVNIPLSDVKNPEFLAVNPNGRLPAIHDPNTNITLWESGAIIEYLIERYDTEHKLSFPAGTNESFLAKQWLFFQASGQGPYYGQAAWFKKFHFEHLPSALDRYAKEVNRVSGVLEGYLAQQNEKYPGGDGPWLVGNKVSYVDISFFTWQLIIATILSKDEYDGSNYPHVKDWLDRLGALEAVKKVPLFEDKST